MAGVAKIGFHQDAVAEAIGEGAVQANPHDSDGESPGERPIDGRRRVPLAKARESLPQAAPVKP